MTLKRARKPFSTEELAGFIAGRLTRAISELEPRSLLGPWPDSRRKRSHAPAPRAQSFVPSHADDFLEMCHVLQGECVLRCGERFYAVGGGTLGVYPPGTAHGEHFRQARIPYESVSWMLRPDGLIMGYHGYTFRDGRVYFGRIHIETPGQEVRNAGRNLAQFAAAEALPSVVPVKEALLTWTLCLLRNSLSAPEQKRSEARRAVVRQAQAYIEPRLARPLSVAEVAHSVLLSPNYLTTAFRMETGLSLGNYIKRRRIDGAKDLLAGTARSVKDIAYALGFSDPYTFSRTFRTVTGLSPSRYRETVRG
ncbi:MAG: helix-turn-helix transcriptional regulator [Kiritimatiellae bacterium]|nr:helix-turn-helix transcriptional regulator [Kiritimatiellia bacterium]